MSKQHRNPSQWAARAMSHVAEWSTIALLLAAPLWMLSPLVDHGTAKLILILAGGLLILSALTLKSWLVQQIDARIPWTFAGLFLFAIAGLCALGTATNVGYILGSLLVLGVFVLLGTAVTQLSATHVGIKRILGALLAAGCVATLVAILQYVGCLGDPVLHPVSRVTSTFGNRNYLGSFLGVLAFPSLALMLQIHRKALRIAAWTGSALCFFGLALVQQTGILLALPVGMVFILVGITTFGLGRYIRRHSRMVMGLMLAALLGLGAGLTLWRLEPFGEEVRSSDSIVEHLWNSNSGETREVDWGTAWEMFKTNPFTGVGLGNYKVDFLDYKTIFLSSPRGVQYTTPVGRAAQAHNDYLQIAAELGVPGIVAMIVMIVLLVGSSWIRCRGIRSESKRLAYLLLLAGLVVGGTHAVVSFPFHLPVTALTLVTLLGVASSTYFGDRATIRVQLSGHLAKWLAAVMLVGIGCVGGLCVRELAAHLSFSAGVSNMEAGASLQAAELLERSLAMSGFNAETKFRLASVSLWRSDQARRLGNTSQADTLLQTAWANAKLSQAEYPTEQGLLLLAGIAVMRGEYSAAEEGLVRLLASHPRPEFEKGGRYLSATLDARTGALEAGMEALRDLIDEFPAYMQPYILLANLLLQQGSTQEGMRILDQGESAAEEEMQRIAEELSCASRSKRELLLFDQQRLALDRQTLEALRDGR